MVDVTTRLAIGITPEGNLQVTIQSGVLSVSVTMGPDGADELAANLHNCADLVRGNADAIVTDVKNRKVSRNILSSIKEEKVARA